MKDNTYTFSKRIKTLLCVDFRRLFTSIFFYIIIGTCLLSPVLIVVMTTMMDGTVNVDQNGNETEIHKFDSVWQILGASNKQENKDDETSDEFAKTEEMVEDTKEEETKQQAGMDIMAFCNIDLLIFGFVVLVSMFVASEFRSGYVKHLFTSRSSHGDYVLSKLIVCSVGGILMVASFILGGVIGALVSNIPFSVSVLGITEVNLIMCILSKLLLPIMFVPVYLLVSLLGKQRLWLSMVIGMLPNMLLFMIVPLISPLTSTYINVLICLLVGVVISVVSYFIGKIILKKTSII